MTSDLRSFLAECPEPSAEEATALRTFLEKHQGEGELKRPLVLISSGGTTVPLEKQCVRFIDNFTTGSRGALSAEQFLKSGYAVIFFTREQSYQPFTLHLRQNPILALAEYLRVNSGKAEIRSDNAEELNSLLTDFQKTEDESLLHVIHFKTVFDYLKKLEMISKALGRLNEGVMFYLAAAVADFYVPFSEMGEHKIQSSDGNLNLSLRVVPKALRVLRTEWAPKSFVVSFKLETDEDILIDKAKKALETHGVHAVVANLLQTRKSKVLLLHNYERGVAEIETITIAADSFIEEPLVKRVSEMHKQYVNSFQSR